MLLTVSTYVLLFIILKRGRRFKVLERDGFAVVNLAIHKVMELLIVQVLETVEDSSQVPDHHVFGVASCFDVLNDCGSVVLGVVFHNKNDSRGIL